MRKMKRFLALALAATMTISSMSVTSYAATGVRPEDGVTEEQPFLAGTGGSQQFRIPCLVTLDDGTIVAACDARWTTYADGGGLDTIVSRSTDGGKTWNYTFANYLGDNGNVWNASSTAFIDPAMTTDGENIYMIADLYPAGIGLNGANYAPQTGHTGYDADGNLALAAATASVTASSTSSARAGAAYNYHLEKIDGAADTDAAYYLLKDAEGNTVEGYTIDAFFNIKGDGVDTNLFCGDSPYFPYPTDFLYMTRSSDGGATWSIPTLLDLKGAEEQTLLVGPGRGTVTSTGRIVFTAYEYTSGDKFSCTLYSDDNGTTWHRGQDVSGWSSESTITEADGKLYLFTRHGNCYYVSDDMGETWGAPVSVEPAYNSNCMISAITYSEKIDGKSAILLAAPSSTSSRANGKIFLGLVQEDSSIEWVNEYTVNDGHYAYSCLTELSNGNIGLLYENAGSSILFEEISLDRVLGYVKDLELSLGSVYTEEKSATSAPEITQKPDASVAAATSEFIVEESTTVLHAHTANSAQSVSGSFSATADDTTTVANAEFTFTASDDKWHITNEYADNAVVIKLAKEYFGDTAADVTVTKVDGDEAKFRLSIYDSEKAQDRYMVFYDTNMVFDAWATNDVSSVTNTAVHFDLVLFEKQDTVSADDIIPGYTRATEVKDGGKYLIAYEWDDSIIVLYPTNGQAAQTKLVGETKTVSKSVVTITATGIGETTAVIGDVVYNITVPDPKEDPTYSASDYDVTKITYTTGSEQPASGSEGPVSYAFDGNETTFWHSAWTPTWDTSECADHLWVAMEFEEATTVDAIRYLSRGGNGDITAYRVDAKTTESGDEWVTLTEGTWASGSSEWKLAQFEATEATAVRLVATGTYGDSGNNKFASARELRVRTVDTTPTPEPTPTPTPTPEVPVVELRAFEAAVLVENAKANSEQLPIAWTNDGGAGWAFDGDTTHWWHSRYQDWDQKSEWEIGSQAGDGKPSADNQIWIQTGFDQVWYVDSITYLPRDNGHGVIKDYTVSVANLEDPTAEPTDEDFTVVKEGTLEPTIEEQTIKLDEVVAATHVRITVASSYMKGDADGVDGDGHVAARDMKIYGYDSDPTAVDKTALEAKVAEYAAVDTSVYTDETAAAFAEALAAAQAVLAKEDATQEEVNAAVATLEAAYAALEEKEETPDPVSNIIPVSEMKATAGDEELINGDPSVEGPANLAIDENENTIWHTDWYEGPNYDEHWLQLELNSAYTIDSLRYLPRQTGNTNGIITSYKVLVSMDGNEWTEVAEGTWDSVDRDWKVASFEPVKAKYVRLKSEGGETDIGIALTCAAEVRLTGVVVECTEHTVELVGAKEATCTEAGHTGNEMCTNCGTVIKAGEEIAALGHAWGEAVVTEATCTEDGSSVKTCETCGEEVVEVLPATGHDLSEWTVVAEATCTEAGSKEATCATCGEKVTEEIAALGHAWGEWTVVKEATTEEEGLEERVCTTCGEKEEHVIGIVFIGNPFIDVFETDWYYKAVIWGSENTVVAGITEDTFVPAANCTRAQIVAFLWRAAGRPEPTSTDCPFTDVESTAYYYKAMLWAVEKGIAKGYADDLFAPDETCTRAEMAAFLWRIDGRKDVEGENPFTDIVTSDWYYDEAIWASLNNVVSGYTDGTFAPNNTITRAEAVTMLYRYYKSK